MIKVENLMRRYGGFTAVDDVSFNINQGEIVGLLGHNGAGKTTIMKMMTGFLEPTGGRIEIDGLNIEGHRRAIQAKIGYLPENCPVYPEMTVIDYLRYAAELHGVAASERGPAVKLAITRTELWDKATQSISTLSRGYRQRVGVAQAILHHPQIVILDEPTNGLDPSQIQHMRELIKQLAEQATVILSTHILQEVQAICDRVIIIRAGRKALDARLDDLQKAQRLLLTLDSPPEQVRGALTALPNVVDVDYLNGRDNRHHYALRARDGSSEDIAPAVAGAVQASGAKLFALYPERRDLERVFGEINASESKGVAHG